MHADAHSEVHFGSRSSSRSGIRSDVHFDVRILGRKIGACLDHRPERSQVLPQPSSEVQTRRSCCDSSHRQELVVDAEVNSRCLKDG